MQYWLSEYVFLVERSSDLRWSPSVAEPNQPPTVEDTAVQIEDRLALFHSIGKGTPGMRIQRDGHLADVFQTLGQTAVVHGGVEADRFRNQPALGRLHPEWHLNSALGGLEGAVEPGTYVRHAGLDIKRGELGLPAGKLLTARDLGLAATLNHAWLPVRRRPRIALLATGDELVRPGQASAPGDIVNSNTVALAAMVQVWGGTPTDLGIARDELPPEKDEDEGDDEIDFF